MKKVSVVGLALLLGLTTLLVVTPAFAKKPPPPPPPPPKDCLCPDVYAPVICSNGIVYSNACRAGCAGATNCVPFGDTTPTAANEGSSEGITAPESTTAPDGATAPDGPTAPDTAVAEEVAVDGSTVDEKSCGSESGVDSYSSAMGDQSPAATSSARGGCICPSIVAPVKCDNGVTYINQCRANCAHARNCVPTGDI